MAQKCTLIINPTSGGFRRNALDRAVVALTEGGMDPQLLFTEGPDDAALFASRLTAEDPASFIIACGGDGTINGVVNGIRSPSATLGILPFGTSSVLAKEIGIRSFDQAVSCLLRGSTRPLSVGRLEWHGGSRLFFLMAGIGFDGAVVEGVRLSEKRMIGKGAYVLSGLRRLVDWDNAQMKVVADGHHLECHGVVICNASRYGGGFIMAPQADIFSPGLQLICIQDCRRLPYFRLLSRLMLGKGPVARGIAVTNATEVVIQGSKPVQIDGDYFCHGPVRISVVKDFVNLVV